MFGLSNNVKIRLAFYKSKMPTHGKTLKEVIHNYASPAYCSKGPCPSFADNDAVKGWYGFPEIGKAERNRFPRQWQFNGIWGLRCIGAGASLQTYDSEITLRDAEGYYCDNFADRTVYPLVFKLNHDRGYLIGRYESDNGEVYISHEVYKDSHSAFLVAHSDCSRYAESCRDDDMQFQAESQIEDLREQNAAIRKNLFALIGDCRAACSRVSDCPTLIQAMKKHIRAELNQLESNRQRIESLTESPWLAVEMESKMTKTNKNHL